MKSEVESLLEQAEDARQKARDLAYEPGAERRWAWRKAAEIWEKIASMTPADSDTGENARYQAVFAWNAADDYTGEHREKRNSLAKQYLAEVNVTARLVYQLRDYSS